MELWVLLESLGPLESLVELVFLEYLELREILVLLDLKVVLVFRDQEVKQESLECLGSLERWALLAKMGPMVRREDLVFLVPLDPPVSLDHVVNLVLMETPDLQELRD